MFSEFDEGVGQALVAWTSILAAAALCQWLEGRHQDGAAGRIQVALQPEQAMHVFAHAQAAPLRERHLLLQEAFGIDPVAHLLHVLAELRDIQSLGVLHELRLGYQAPFLVQCVLEIRHHHQVVEPDVAALHRGDRVRKLIEIGAHANRLDGVVPRHMRVLPQELHGRVVAVVHVAAARLRVAPRQARKFETHQVDLMRLFHNFLPGRSCSPNPLDHALIIERLFWPARSRC
ncbi:MAG TPA: hypothetical protein VF160_09740 [Candidatus Dormibacteraeota bacterium]